MTPAPWSSNMPMEQRFQFGPPPTPPSASNPNENFVSQNPNIIFGPPVGSGAAAGPDGVSRLTAPSGLTGDGALHPAMRKITSNHNRNSTLGLSFHNRLERIRWDVILLFDVIYCLIKMLVVLRPSLSYELQRSIAREICWSGNVYSGVYALQISDPGDKCDFHSKFIFRATGASRSMLNN